MCDWERYIEVKNGAKKAGPEKFSRKEIFEGLWWISVILTEIKYFLIMREGGPCLKTALKIIEIATKSTFKHIYSQKPNFHSKNTPNYSLCFYHLNCFSTFRTCSPKFHFYFHKQQASKLGLITALHMKLSIIFKLAFIAGGILTSSFFSTICFRSGIIYTPSLVFTVFVVTLSVNTLLSRPVLGIALASALLTLLMYPFLALS